MDEAFRAGGLLDKTPSKPAKDSAAAALKREDIDLIVRIPSMAESHTRHLISY